MKINHLIVAMLVTAGFSGATHAESISKEAFETAIAQADSVFKIAKQKCETLSGNTRNICLAQAKGVQSVTKATAEANYERTESARLKAAEAKVEAEYQVAKERCEALSGGQRDTCREEAKAIKVKGDEAARLASKTAEATEEFLKTTKEARQKAGQVSRDADYKVAIEKCKQLSGQLKEQCVQDAKTKFGK